MEEVVEFVRLGLSPGGGTESTQATLVTPSNQPKSRMRREIRSRDRDAELALYAITCGLQQRPKASRAQRQLIRLRVLMGLKLCQHGQTLPADLKHSACIPGAVDAAQIAIDGDHINTVKFKSAEDSGFRMVSGQLSIMLEKALPKIIIRPNKEPKKPQ